MTAQTKREETNLSNSTLLPHLPSSDGSFKIFLEAFNTDYFFKVTLFYIIGMVGAG